MANNPLGHLPLAMNPFGLAALYGNHGLNFPGALSFGALPPTEGLIPVPILPQSKPEIVQGFYVFQEGIPCTDGFCAFIMKHHFHCSKPRCYFVTDQQEHLLEHSKDFHDKIEILENFVFFDKSVDCRLKGCASNRVSRHYHCTVCNYSFIQYSVMSVHNESHPLNLTDKVDSSDVQPKSDHNQNLPLNLADKVDGADMQPKSKTPTMTSGYMSATPSGNSSTHSDDDPEPSNPSSPEDRKARIKSAGTFYPLSSLPKASAMVSRLRAASRLAYSTGACDVQSKHDDRLQKNDIYNLKAENIHKLLQESVAHQNAFANNEMVKHRQYGQEPEYGCGRPFCKLKKRDHFHW